MIQFKRDTADNKVRIREVYYGHKRAVQDG